MPGYRYSAFILFVITSAFPLAAQQVQEDRPEPFYFVALTDPACPVSGYAALAPVTKEIRFLYFPMGRRATIKEPESPVLHVVLNNGFAQDDNQTLPFIRRDDGVWLATVALRDWAPAQYAIYWVEDRGSGQTDTNEGKYFEVPFCDVEGRREEQSVRLEAESYTGALAAHGIERPVNYAKAIEVLEEYIHPPSRGENLISSLWKYKLKVQGDRAEARATLLTEINSFIGDHSADGFGLIDALNFAAYQDWLPPETTERLVKALDNKYPDYNHRAFLLGARSSREKDKAKRIALMWELVDKYPESQEADVVRNRLLLEVPDLSQKERLYQQLRTRNPDDPFAPWNMASMYFRANQKLPDALAMLDEADKLFAASVKNTHAKIHYPESTLKDVKTPDRGSAVGDFDPIGQDGRSCFDPAAPEGRVHVRSSLLLARQGVGGYRRQAGGNRCVFGSGGAPIKRREEGECRAGSLVVEPEARQRAGFAEANRDQARAEPLVVQTMCHRSWDTQLRILI
jgi:hypothetical protein